MKLPRHPNNIQHRKVQTLEFKGLNLTNLTQDGEFVDTLGLQSDGYPYITQIPERTAMTGYTSPTDIFVWDRDLYVVDGTNLKKNGTTIGTVTEGQKQMAVINTKLVIWPDKKYVDLTNGTVSSLGTVPDLDFICSSNNRIWGCQIANNTIYASALGDPTDFDDYTSESGAYTVAVGSEGDFTGICNYGGAVLCWKENMLHKILGSYPSEYYMIDAPVFGVQKGSEKSLTVINNVLYYKGIYGVYQFAGNQPVLISPTLGRKIFTHAVGGTDGKKYYLNMADPSGAYHLYAYDLHYGIWLKEEDGKMAAIANLDRDVYLVTVTTSGNTTTYALKKIGTSVASNLSWTAEFAEITEEMFARKGYLKLLMRLDMAAGSGMTIYAKEDRRVYRAIWTQTTTSNVTLLIPIRLGRCDRWQLKITGTGAVTIRAIGREHVTGSEK